MRFLSVLSIVTFLLLSSALVCAQSPSAQTSQSESTAPEPTGEPAPLIFWNREITVLRSNYEHLSPAERASKAAERLAALPQVASWNVTSHPATSGRYSGTLISVNGQLAFAILSTDVDSESGQTLQAASDQAAANLRSALEARSKQALWPVRLKGIGLSLVATLFLILGLWLINRLGSLIIRHMNQKVDSGLLGLKFGGLDLRAIARGIENGVTKLTMWAGSAVLIYLWLAFVLLRFPYSQPWGQQLGRFLTNLFAKLGIGMLKAMPGIFTVAVIFLLTRLIARINRNLRRDRLLGRATHTRDRYPPRAWRAIQGCAAYDRHTRHDARSHRSRFRVSWSICGHARDEGFVVRRVCYRSADFYRCVAALNRGRFAGLLHSCQTRDES